MAVAVAEPLFPPKQSMFTEEAIVTVGDPALGTVTVVEAEHPFASVTMTL